MTTEFVLLLSIAGFLVVGVFFGDSGPRSVFARSGPRLGARLEREISTGRTFRSVDGTILKWQKPPGPPPGGAL